MAVPVLFACFSLFERFFSSAGADPLGWESQACSDGWSVARRPVRDARRSASTPEDSFLLGMFVVIAFIIVSVPVGIAQLANLIMNTGASVTRRQ